MGIEKRLFTFRFYENRPSSVERAAQALGDAGLTVEERRAPNLERGAEMWGKLFSRPALVHLRDVYAGHEHEAGLVIRSLLSSVDEIPLRSTTISAFG
jgi:hypothetical protein